MTGTGLMLLRVALALVSIAHGAHTLFGTMGGPGSGMGPGGLDDSAARFAAMGLPGFPMAVVTGLVQFVGGILLGVGYLTRWAAISLAGFTAILAWKAQSIWGLFINWIDEPGRGHGVEFSIVLIAAFVCIAMTGGGDWSMDGRKARRAGYVAAGRARLKPWN